jgi:chemotaxis protein CheC
MITMNDNQRDALLEIFNVGVGHAAASLSLIVKDEVSMSVPKVSVLLDQERTEDSAIFGKERICAVSQHFTGPFDAEAMLIFPEDKTMLIVQKMLGEGVAAEDLSEMEQDALSEIGNIILNTCISTISDMFQKRFSSSTPTYRVCFADQIVNAPSSSESVVLLLHIEFFLKQDQIHGYLVLLLNVHSYARLLASIDALLARYGT